VGLIEKIVSGGQTGADRAGLDAAIAAGVPHGGWCPAGRRAEDGRIPRRYALKETATPAYPARTKMNVRDSDGTVIFTLRGMGGGSALTADMARELEKPCLSLELEELEDADAADRVAAFISHQEIRVLNVAGSRESTEPGIYARVLEVMTFLLELPDLEKESAGDGS